MAQKSGKARSSKRAAVAPDGDERRTKRARRARASEPEPSDSAVKPSDSSNGEDEIGQTIVVGIGASAGGLGAYKRLLRDLPKDTGMAFVLIQHLDPDHESLMSQLLSKSTQMAVIQVNAATRVEPDKVYVIPPNKYISLESDRLLLEDPVKERGLRMPIDNFFRSVAETRAERGVCIVLSGTGADGVQGLKEVKAAGGMTIVQRPETAEYQGMPQAALASGMVDFVVPIEEMPAILTKYARHPYARAGADPSQLIDASPDHFLSILELVRSRTGHDFRRYKSGTLSRRIQRRMSLRRVESLEDYFTILNESTGEVEAIYRDLLIGVTSFFRDKEAWEALEKDVIASVVEKKKAREPVRAWVPGCATGEEAYSLAIGLSEAFARRNETPEMLVFGTDVHDQWILRARAGQYPASIATDLPPDRLSRYFVEDGDHFRVVKRLRESVILATQNLVTEPPFSNLDILSCRNVLMYLEREVQRKLVRLLHFALRDGGYLFLGPSESVPDGDELFSPISTTWRIYQKREQDSGRGRPFPIVPVTAVPERARKRLRPEESRRSRAVLAADVAREALLDSFAPPSVLVDRAHEVHYFHGPLGEYLSMPSGEPTRHLPALVRDELRSKLRRLLRAVPRDGKASTAVASWLAHDGRPEAVRIRVAPVGRDEIDWYVVSFVREPTPKRDGRTRSPAGTTGKGASEPKLVRELRQELEATREDLEATIQELEASNDELQGKNERIISMNEQLQSMNEEFQSTNQEMETSREELQSLNEELSTVNTELQEKVVELEATNDDLSNLLASTEIAAIFLDTDFRIRRFTPACTELLRVIAGDVGRPVSDLSVRVNDPHLLHHARMVLRKLLPKEARIQRDEQHFMRRILPFRTSGGKVEGVVVTFTEITQLERAHLRVEVRERQQEVVAKLGRLALSKSESESLLEETVRVVAETLDVPFAEILELTDDGAYFRLVAGVGFRSGLVGSARVDVGARSQAGFTLQSGHPVVVSDLADEKRFSGPRLLTDHGITSGITIAIGPGDDPWGVLGAHSSKPREFSIDDVNFLQSVAHVLTEAIRRRKSEKEAADRERRMNLITDAMPVLISYCDRNRVYRFCNRNYQKWFGLERDRILGRSVVEVIGTAAYENVKHHIDRVLAGEPVTFDAELDYRHGSTRTVHINYIPHYHDGDEVAGYYAMIEDVSDRVQAERTRARLAAIVEHSSDAIFAQRLDGRITDCNQAAERLFARPPKEIVGETLSSLGLGDPNALQGALDRVRRGEPVESFEATYSRGSGPTLDVSVTISAIRDAAGEISGASVIARDVSARKRAERALKEWADRLEERVAERTAVAEKRAADLRALTTELTQADQRARKRLAKEMHDNLQQTLVAAKMRVDTDSEEDRDAEGRSRRGWPMVSDLLDQALDTSRALVSELSPPVLQAGTVTDVLTWLARHMAKQHGLHVRLHAESESPVHVDEWAKTVVFEVVRELLFNVVKHAGTNEATVEARTEEGKLHIRVSDSGKGFDADEILERAEGFGLLSVRERVAGLGGTFEVESVPDQGSTVLVTLPIPKVERSRSRLPARGRPAARKKRRASHEALRLLVVDDHKIMREGLVRILSSEPGMEVIAEASDGEDAVEKASRLRPDVIVMDITMPKLNGIEATRAIMESLPETIVIGLSLHDDADVAATIKQAGAVSYLQKDSASTTLIQAIREHCPPPEKDGSPGD